MQPDSEAPPVLDHTEGNADKRLGSGFDSSKCDTKTTLAEALITGAREWRDAGYNVVPSHRDGGKRPFGLWTEYQAKPYPAETLEKQIRSGRHTGIGLITGAVSGNRVMLEIEGPKPSFKNPATTADRLTKVKELAEQQGHLDLLNKVIGGCSEISAGQGLHMFAQIVGELRGSEKLAYVETTEEYRHAEAEKARAANRAKGIDDSEITEESFRWATVAETKGEGGFVMVAPTPGRNGHPDGSAYRLVTGTGPATTAVISAGERDVLCLLLWQALNEKPGYEPPTHRRLNPTPAPAPSKATGDDVFASPSRPWDGVSTFDDYRARVAWSDILEPFGWTWSHRDSDHDYWVRPGKDKRDGHSATTVEDGPLVNWSSSADLPLSVPGDIRALTKPQVYAHLRHGGDMSAAARDLHAQGYGDRQDTGSSDLGGLIDDSESDGDQQEDLKQKARDRFPAIDWHELWAEDDPGEEWIAEPLLARRRGVSLYSPAKAGKSLLMLEIAVQVANGESVFGYEARPPVTVLYVDFENDPRGDVRSRLKAMGRTPDHLGNLKYLSFPNLTALDTARGGTELMAAAVAYDADLVIIDTASRVVEGKENENDTWIDFYRHTGMRLKRAGIAYVRLDHSGKDESRGARGGSAKSGDVDAIWQLRPEGDDVVILKCDDARFLISEKYLPLRREATPVLRHVIDPHIVRQRRSEAVGAAMRDLAARGIDMHDGARKAWQALKDAGVTLHSQRTVQAAQEQRRAQAEQTLLVDGDAL